MISFSEFAKKHKYSDSKLNYICKRSNFLFTNNLIDYDISSYIDVVADVPTTYMRSGTIQNSSIRKKIITNEKAFLTELKKFEVERVALNKVINAAQKKGSKWYIQWTQSAIDCFLNNCRCETCSIYMEHKKCKMKAIVIETFSEIGAPEGIEKQELTVIED